MLGGGQQNNYRSGTENISGILGMQKAIQIEYDKIEENYKKVSEFKHIFVDKIKSELSQFDYRINGDISSSSPYILSVSFNGIRSEVLMHLLEENGVIVGTGSACSSKKQDNRVLEAMGQHSEFIKGNIRISFSSDNTKEEVESASEIFVQTVKTLYKNMSR